ncbi:MAG: HEAT repeat domain-containing protein, partial [Planctomycetales bacterium]
MTQPTNLPTVDSDRSASTPAGLPPVQPPSAGFILQLFVIPGVIVLIIVLVWLAFHWLAQMGSDPAALIKEMRKNNANSWQLAHNLSEELQQNKQSRNDPELAKELANFLNTLLSEQLPEPGKDPRTRRDPRSEEILRRGFLCKALGELDITDDALPVLIKAASSHKDDDELRVRLAAMEAIALLAEKKRDTDKPVQNPQLLPLLLAASKNEDRKIATRAAMGLTALGSQDALQRLTQMLDEPHHIDVHYNTALGLARHGKSACLETLYDMLDPQQLLAIADEPDEQKEYKRVMILLNALRVTRQLAG